MESDENSVDVDGVCRLRVRPARSDGSDELLKVLFADGTDTAGDAAHGLECRKVLGSVGFSWRKQKRRLATPIETRKTKSITSEDSGCSTDESYA